MKTTEAEQIPNRPRVLNGLVYYFSRPLLMLPWKCCPMALRLFTEGTAQRLVLIYTPTCCPSPVPTPPQLQGWVLSPPYQTTPSDKRLAVTNYVIGFLGEYRKISLIFSLLYRIIGHINYHSSQLINKIGH